MMQQQAADRLIQPDAGPGTLPMQFQQQMPQQQAQQQAQQQGMGGYPVMMYQLHNTANQVPLGFAQSVVQTPYVPSALSPLSPHIPLTLLNPLTHRRPATSS